MAQKVQVLLVDDLDGGDAKETVSFAIDGSSYEIDLSDRNAKALRDAMAKFVGSARKVGRTSGVSRSASRTRGGGGSAAIDRDQAAAIRAWAKKKGLKVSDRGRIPAAIIEQYNAKA